MVKPGETLARFRDARDKGMAYLLIQLADDRGFPAQKPNRTDYDKALTAL